MRYAHLVKSSSRTVGTVSLAVVGLGRWGSNYLRTLAALPGVRVAAVVDPSEEARVRAASLVPHSLQFPSIGDALAHAKVDGVVISSPSETHAGIAVTALEQGLAVLVEKPVATTVRDAHALCRPEFAGKLLAGHLAVHHPALQQIQSLVENNAIGEVRQIAANRASAGSTRSSESALWALGPHDACTVVRLLGSPSTVRCESRLPNEQAVVMRTRFASGGSAVLTLSRQSAAPTRELRVEGALGSIRFDEQTGALTVLRRGGPVTRNVLTPEQPLLELQCRHFLGCVSGAESPRSGVADAVAVTRLLVAAGQSLAQRGAEAALDIWPPSEGVNAPRRPGIEPSAA